MHVLAAQGYCPCMRRRWDIHYLGAAKLKQSTILAQLQ